VQGGATLWRLSVPQTAPPLALSGEQLVEWGGAQRWLCTSTPAAQLREAAALQWAATRCCSAAGQGRRRLRAAERAAGEASTAS
jgi:hypothetical protein